MEALLVSFIDFVDCIITGDGKYLSDKFEAAIRLIRKKIVKIRKFVFSARHEMDDGLRCIQREYDRTRFRTYFTHRRISELNC